MRLTNGNASLRCDYCKSMVVAAADDTGVQFLDEVMDLLCPLCAVPLWNAVLARVQMHACKRCHGLLVLMESLDPLIEQMRAGNNNNGAVPPPADPSELNQIVNCPKCHHRMDTHYYYGGGQAVISGCETCDWNWLDGGVLMRMVHAPHASSAYSSEFGDSTENT
jgi:Zn-finger nucleic acid-binding protein